MKLKLGDFEWVRKAVSTDEARPVLTAVHVGEDGGLEATDGHRLHIAPKARPHAFKTGLFRPTDFTTVEGTYPDTSKVFGEPKETLTANPQAIERLCRAALAASVGHGSSYVTIPSPSGPIYVNPEYVLGIIEGATDASIAIEVIDSVSPVTFRLGEGRIGCSMPVRVNEPPSGDYHALTSLAGCLVTADVAGEQAALEAVNA